MGTMWIIIKISTIMAHHQRTLALTAPKNMVSAVLKYVVVPGFVTFLLERDRYKVMMSDV
jgi:hypothetical protein